MKNTTKNFVFSYPVKEEAQMSTLEWPKSDNIEFAVNNIDVSDKGIIKKGYHCFKELKKTANLVRPEKIILMDVVAFMPYVSLLSYPIIGLIGTGIYLYTWKEDKLRKKIENSIKYYLFSKCKSFQKIYIQCDSSAVAYLCKKYRTNKFDYICDPVPRLALLPNNLREELRIPSDKIIILHPGELSNRKGSLDLLKGILHCNKEILSKYYFIFAGRVNKSIKNEFHSLVDEVKQKADFLLIEGFISFDYLASLVYTSDLLFLPYKLTNQSSGFVGYGAEYKKPVIVTKEGLLGKIVRKYQLGYLINDTSIESIVSILNKSSFYLPPCEKDYLSDNTVEEFAQTMLS